MGILKITTSLLAALFILTGCGSNSLDHQVMLHKINYPDKVLKSYLGVSELDLIRAWGVPQSSYVNNGVKFILYKASHTSVSSYSSSPTYYYGRSVAIPISGGKSKTVSTRNWCEVTFEISNKIVSYVTQNGNNCYELTSKAGISKITKKNNKDNVF